MIKHVQELTQPPHGFICFAWWVGVDNDQSIAGCISDSRKATDMEQELAEREPQSLKYIVANSFTHNCATRIVLAPYEHNYPMIISTHSGCQF